MADETTSTESSDGSENTDFINPENNTNLGGASSAEESDKSGDNTANDKDSSGSDKDNDSDEQNVGGEDKDVDFKDFDLPEGMDLDQDLLEAAAPLFKELGLTKEQAQKLVDIEAARLQREQQNFQSIKSQWLDEAKADKEIGGEKYEENLADALVFMGKFGTPELKTLLNDTGVGNHPEVIRVFSKAGKLIKEDTPVPSGGNSSTEKKDRVTVLYGEQK